MNSVFLIFSILLNPLLISGDNSLFYCVSWDCQEPISFGKTLLVYQAKSDKHLSFQKNEDIKILSKPIGTGDDWVAEYRGKVGLVPHTMVREQRMSKYNIKYKFPFDELPLTSDEAPLLPVDDEIPDVDLQETDSNPDTESKVDSPEPLPLPDTHSVKDEQVQTSENSNSEEISTPPKDIVVDVDTQGSPSFEILAEPPPETKQPSPEEQSGSAEAEAPVVVQNEEKALNPNPLSDSQSTVPPPDTITDIPSYSETTTTTASESLEIPFEQPIETVDSIVETIPFASSVEHIDVKTTLLKNPEEPIPVSIEEEPIPEESQDATTATPPIVEEIPSPPLEIQSDVNTNDEEPSPPIEADVVVESKIEQEPEVTPSPDVVEEEEEVQTASSVPIEIEQESTTDSIPPLPTEPEIPVEETVEDKIVEDTTTPSSQSEEESITQSPVVETLIVTPTDDSSKEDVVDSTIVVDPIQVPSSDNHDDNNNKFVESTTETIPDEPQSQSINVEPIVESVPESEIISETNIPIDEPQSEVETPVVDSIIPKEQEGVTETIPIPVVDDLSETTTTANVDNVESVESAQIDKTEPEVVTEGQDNETPTEQPVVDDSATPSQDSLPVESVTQVPSSDPQGENVDPEIPTVETVEQEASIPADEPVTETPETIPIPVSTEEFHHHHEHEHSNEDHSHHHHHHHHHRHPQDYNTSSTSPLVTVLRHLSATLMSFLPEALQDSILDVNDAQIFTGIVALALISLCVPYFFIATVMSTRPLKKQVEELSNSLWKSKTAYEIQLDEFEVYKKKALAHDAKLKRIEQLENELLVANKLLTKQKEQIKILQKELKITSRAAGNFESVMEGTRKKKDEAIAERDNLLVGIQSLQEALKSNVAELEDSQAEARLIKEQFEKANHEKETFSKLLNKAEHTIEIVKVKTANEHELRRQAEEMNGKLRSELETVQEEMKSVKDICEQYEKTASALSEEVTSKENELLALKETLGEDSPLIEIAEAKARSTTAEEEANALRKRVESMSIEISSLSRNYEETKSEFTTIKEEKEDAENRLQVLETWFKKQEDELRATVEKYETERNIRGKDEHELIKIIHDKDDEISQLKEAKEALKQEIEEITTTDKAEIRKLEARIGDNFLQMCQSERKINEARKEAELLRQKLASVARQGEENGAGDLYSDINPLPPLPDDLTMNMPMPSYFGMDDLLDPLPPLPLGDYSLGSEPSRPVPVGRMSPTPHYGYPGEDGPSPIAPGNRGDYSNYSSGSDSPIDNTRPGSRDNFINENDRSDRPRSMRHHRGGPIPTLSSSPIPHGVNL